MFAVTQTGIIILQIILNMYDITTEVAELMHSWSLSDPGLWNFDLNFVDYSEVSYKYNGSELGSIDFNALYNPY